MKATTGALQFPCCDRGDFHLPGINSFPASPVNRIDHHWSH